MRDLSRDRAVLLGEFIADTGATVRCAGKKYGVSKSTVHKDVSVKLKKTDYELYLRVKEVLERNKAERHIRGGEATKRMYQLKYKSHKSLL